MCKVSSLWFCLLFPTMRNVIREDFAKYIFFSRDRCVELRNDLLIVLLDTCSLRALISCDGNASRKRDSIDFYRYLAVELSLLLFSLFLLLSFSPFWSLWLPLSFPLFPSVLSFCSPLLSSPSPPLRGSFVVPFEPPSAGRQSTLRKEREKPGARDGKSEYLWPGRTFLC